MRPLSMALPPRVPAPLTVRRGSDRLSPLNRSSPSMPTSFTPSGAIKLAPLVIVTVPSMRGSRTVPLSCNSPLSVPLASEIAGDAASNSAIGVSCSVSEPLSGALRWSDGNASSVAATGRVSFADINRVTRLCSLSDTSLRRLCSAYVPSTLASPSDVAPTVMPFARMVSWPVGASRVPRICTRASSSPVSARSRCVSQPTSRNGICAASTISERLSRAGTCAHTLTRATPVSPTTSESIVVTSGVRTMVVGCNSCQRVCGPEANMEVSVATSESPAPRVRASSASCTPLSARASIEITPSRVELNRPFAATVFRRTGPASTLSAVSCSAPLGTPRTQVPVAVRSATAAASVPLSTSRPDSVAATSSESIQPDTRPRNDTAPPSESGASAFAVLSHARRPPSESALTRNTSESLRSARNPRPPCAIAVSEGERTLSESTSAMPSRNVKRAVASSIRNASSRERPNASARRPSAFGSESPRRSTSALKFSSVTGDPAR